jgi:hypothetical protein
VFSFLSFFSLRSQECATPRRRPPYFLCALAAPAALLPTGAGLAADATAPFATANRSPLLLPVGLPDARSASLLPNGATRLRSTVEVANTSLYEPSLCDQGCSLALDGETTRLAIAVERGFGDHWEASLTVPSLRHGGGFLDEAIEGWHDVFGLPNGDRENYPQDRIRFRFRLNDGGVAISDSVSGIGDLQLGLARRLGERFAVRTQVEVPTGEAEDLTGSGGTDVAVSLHFSSKGNGGAASAASRLYSHLSAGVVLREDGDLLPAIQERWLYFGSATVGWRMSERWDLKAQVDAHSGAWESPREALGEPSAQLVVRREPQIGRAHV